MKNVSSLLLLLMGLLLPAGAGWAQPASVQVGATTVGIRTLATGLTTPWEIVWGPDGYLWLTERPGRISRLHPDTGQLLPLFTVPDVKEKNESGLLGMALHPDFARQPYVYVVYNYTAPDGGLLEKLVRYTYDGTTLTAPLVLLGNLPAQSTHSGSRLLILPDKTLLMTTGDAQNQPAAQDRASLNGKVLRLNLDGSVPANNPTPGSYVYSLGHRNPQGLTQAPSGRIYSSEHGPNTDDEVNLLEPDRNYGWPLVQGYCNLTGEVPLCQKNNIKEPLYAWTPTLAVAGLQYYPHAAIPGWQNGLLLVSLKAGQFLHLPLTAAGDALAGPPEVVLNQQAGRLRALCVAPDGRVFIGTSNRDGRVTPGPTDDRILVLQAQQPTASPRPVARPLGVWPTPAHESLTVALPGGAASVVTLLDGLGREVRRWQLPATTGPVRLALPAGPAGLYLLRAQQGPALYQSRVVRR